MKTRITILLTVLAAVAVALPLVALSAIKPAATNIDNPEFYFTRLVYRENGARSRGGLFGFGRGTMPKPSPYHCPEFGGGNFFPPQGWGWATDYPGADCKFMGGIHRLTGLPVYTHPNVVEIMDPDLFKFPYFYIVEPGGLYLDEQEAARLREYFARGGFLHVDDFWGLWQRANFEAQMRKVFPNRPMVQLALSHEVFHTFFDIDSVIQVPNVNNGCSGAPTWQSADDKVPRIYGISDDSGRLMVVVTYSSDLGDAWEYMDLDCYPEMYSGAAYRMGLNFMIYAMTH